MLVLATIFSVSISSAILHTPSNTLNIWMKTLFFDCFSGISGDMSVAALLDLGIEFDEVNHEAKKILPEASIHLSTSTTKKCGVSALKFDVNPPFPDTKVHTFADIKQLISGSSLSSSVRELSIEIFASVAAAESHVHGIPIDNVHFHEVGAFDSIMDIICFSVAFTSLNIDEVISTPIPLGFGTVECQHGSYPVPAMATLEILRSIPVYGGDHPKELTTPTGAAIISTIANSFSKTLPEMKVSKIGYGAGTRDLVNQPNVLRVILGEI